MTPDQPEKYGVIEALKFFAILSLIFGILGVFSVLNYYSISSIGLLISVALVIESMVVCTVLFSIRRIVILLQDIRENTWPE